MAIQEYVVRQQGGLWEVKLGDRLLSSQPTYEKALVVAENLAYAAIARGERAKILLGTRSTVDQSAFPGAKSARLWT